MSPSGLAKRFGKDLLDVCQVLLSLMLAAAWFVRWLR